MIEVDCRKCLNCSIEKDTCLLHGSDTHEAVNECASLNFKDYRPINKIESFNGNTQ